ncbi:MAG: exo-alpha-sialidase [Armatimonadetes bacterium]|nr:exo-alpha-sialidase [Armatimonadota bacterium]
MHPCLTSLLLTVAPAQEPPPYHWTCVVNPAPFAPRDGAGALTYKGRMWLLGGWNPGDKAHFPRICNNEVWSSADGAAWRLDKPNTFIDAAFDSRADWEGRHTAGYVVHRGKLWIVGGDCNQGHYHTDVWNSDDGAHWTLVTAELPWAPRALHHTVAFRDRIWVMGGQTLPQFAPATPAFHDDIWSSADGVRWERAEPVGPHWSYRGMIGGAAVMNGRLWILGGGTYDTPEKPQREFQHDVWSTDDGVHWTCHTTAAPWTPRQYHDVAVWDGKLWVMEGWNQSNRNDVWYSSDGVEWHELPGTPWAPRHAASVFVHQDALWMVAGNNMQSDVWKLTRDGERG